MIVPTDPQTSSAVGSTTLAIRSLTLTEVSNGGMAGADGCEEQAVLNRKTSGGSHRYRRITQLILACLADARKSEDSRLSPAADRWRPVPGAPRTTAPCQGRAGGERRR